MAEHAPPSDAAKALCQRQVLMVFEDIDRQHLEDLAQEHGYNHDTIIATILDKQDQGHAYPKRVNPLKRKRSHGDDDEKNEDDSSKHVYSKDNIEAKINDPLYLDRMRSTQYKDLATKLLSQDFPFVSKTTIRYKLLVNNGSSVFRTYVAMDNATRNWDENNPMWVEKKTSTKIQDIYSPAMTQFLLSQGLSIDQRAAVDEFLAARRIRDDRNAEVAAETAEKTNLEQARLNGDMGECGCCFDDLPLNRMVSCEGEIVHWFCRMCMTREAETKIGLSKHEITCISTDGCSAGFSSQQRDLFLDKKLRIALDRIEAQAALRDAGIENLETCPFCPEAMEYPPVEENKEFCCPNPTCETSCRLCRKKTHIPKTCAEAATEEGHDARHAIEEAMSQAVIRKCNKCENPYVKVDGCNKIACSRCGNLQCYVCRQSVKDYSHFNDKSRGGKDNQCPLFDQTDERHHNEARQAEEEQRSRVLEKNPQLTVEALKLKMSPIVAEDERKQLENAARRTARIQEDLGNNQAGQRVHLGQDIRQRIAELGAYRNGMRQGPDAVQGRLAALYRAQQDVLLHDQANVFMNAAKAEAQNMVRIQQQAAQAQLNAARILREGIPQLGRAQEIPQPPMQPQQQQREQAQAPNRLVQRAPAPDQRIVDPLLRDNAQLRRAEMQGPAGLLNDNVFLPLIMQARLHAKESADHPPQQGLFPNQWAYINGPRRDERQHLSQHPPGSALNRVNSPAVPANRGPATMNRPRDSRA